MRTRKLMLNTVSSLLLQMTTIICGFVLPRLILNSFGSDINGLVNSITQFLQIITFLELGVGAVVQSSLYKPLAENDNDQISKIIVSANKFFQRIALILQIYVAVLIIIFPSIIEGKYDFFYTAFLILAMCISYFAQYYFGVVNRLLLNSDQRGYIQYTAQIITLVLNTVISVILINAEQSIQMVKLCSSLIFLIRPAILRLYVDRHYEIDRKISYDKEPIKQKWNGIAQHVASVVLDGTDNIVLTVFSTLSNVSVYSVYYLVVSGVKQLFMSMIGGVQSLLGELLAKKDYKELNKVFAWYEWLIHTSVVLIWGTTAILIVPFISVYTRGVTDANYIVPLFAVLITVANAAHCLRLPYNTIILAAGHYKETQINYIVAAVLNIVISVLMVNLLGLIGVAIGTITAMLYQTLWMMNYDSKNIIFWPKRKMYKQIIIDLIICSLYIIVYMFSPLTVSNYMDWIILAAIIFIINFFISLTVNIIFYKNKVFRLGNVIFKRIMKR
ncbi:MAG: lipopolysaccharide biosynthesis protein [Thomasclavelia sp.]